MITCGSFSAMPLAAFNRWEITCSRLPDWRHEVKASRDEIGEILINLQNEYRETWD